jgi:hypothetical protein
VRRDASAPASVTTGQRWRVAAVNTETGDACTREAASACVPLHATLALDDEQARRSRLLLRDLNATVR